MIKIDRNLCTGCGICQKKCLFQAIEIHGGKAAVNDNCVWCGVCSGACPFHAISMPQMNGSGNDLSAYSGVWTIVEIDGATRQPKKVSYELACESRKLADRLGEKVTAVCLCDKEPDGMREDLEQVGCDRLVLVENDALKEYDTDRFADIVCGLIMQKKPSIVLFPATENGRDLAPRVSGRIKAGLTADCTGLDLDEQKRLIQIRPTYGGNIMASILTPDTRPQMASVRPNIFSVTRAQKASTLEVERIEVSIAGEGRVRHIGFEPKETVYKDVGESGFILCGGYGLGQEGMKLLHKLALKTGAAVGATRKVVDEGWAPFDIQIGQTGKTVAPDLYIAFGVSGALQHSIAIQQSKKIIAVNNDPVAPIFTQSDVSILGDAGQVLCQLLEMVDAKKETVFDELAAE